jgi:hypothetical protein
MTAKQFFRKIDTTVFKYQIPRLNKRGEELFPLLDQPEQKPHHPRLRRLLEWLVVPPTLWLMDHIGLSKAFAARLHGREEIDPRMLELLDDMSDVPEAEEQERASRDELDLQTGNYEGLLREPAKYIAMEDQAEANPNLLADWNRIKEVYKIGKFRHHKNGMIRRTQYLERGVPPEEFYFEKATSVERWLFQATFNQFCKRYNLFAMRFDEPMVERLTVTRTRFTTNISVPRWMKFNRDDLLWELFQEKHYDPGVGKQGRKASINEVERIDMLRRIDAATLQAKSENLKGEPLRRRIEDMAKLPPHTDKRTHIRWQNEIKELKKKGSL